MAVAVAAVMNVAILMRTELVSCMKHDLSCAVNTSQCVLHSGSPMCLCNPGFSGETCDVNIDDCHNVICLHGGTCLDDVLAYHCTCMPGYTGNKKYCILEVTRIYRSRFRNVFFSTACKDLSLFKCWTCILKCSFCQWCSWLWSLVVLLLIRTEIQFLLKALSLEHLSASRIVSTCSC